MESQKTVSSWSVRRGQYLTSPTVWSETDGFLTVIDRKVVMPEKELDIEILQDNTYRLNLVLLFRD